MPPTSRSFPAKKKSCNFLFSSNPQRLLLKVAKLLQISHIKASHCRKSDTPNIKNYQPDISQLFSETVSLENQFHLFLFIISIKNHSPWFVCKCHNCKISSKETYTYSRYGSRRLCIWPALSPGLLISCGFAEKTCPWPWILPCIVLMYK